MRVLIVGQGLAGTLLHWQFVKRGMEVQVVDNGWKSSASIGAAGLFNPIVFRRFLMAWRSTDFLPEALLVYKLFEKQLDVQLAHEVPYVKVFGHADDPDVWKDRCEKLPYNEFMHSDVPIDVKALPLKSNFGIGKVTGTGWIDLPTMLNGYREHLIQQGLLNQEAFDYESLSLVDSHVLWKGEKFDTVVFCEGYKGIENPWFSYLPLRKNKGETLWIECDALPDNYILNRNIFVVPLPDGRYRVGATYDYKSQDILPSEEGRQFLQTKFEELIEADYRVTEQWAGIRPAVSDRRPLLGRHTDYRQLAIFNGLGSRGVMNAPTLSRELVAYLIDGMPLDSEADIARFKKEKGARSAFL